MSLVIEIISEKNLSIMLPPIDCQQGIVLGLYITKVFGKNLKLYDSKLFLDFILKPSNFFISSCYLDIINMNKNVQYCISLRKFFNKHARVCTQLYHPHEFNLNKVLIRYKLVRQRQW